MVLLDSSSTQQGLLLFGASPPSQSLACISSLGITREVVRVQILGPPPKPTEQNLPSKTPKQFMCTLKLEEHWFKGMMLLVLIKNSPKSI